MRQLSAAVARLSPAALLPALLVFVSSCSTYRYNDNGTRSYTFAGILYVILAIYAVISLLKQDWSIGKKLIWGLIIWVFPIAGSIIYLLFSGRK